MEPGTAEGPTRSSSSDITVTAPAHGTGTRTSKREEATSVDPAGGAGFPSYPMTSFLTASS